MSFTTSLSCAKEEERSLSLVKDLHVRKEGVATSNSRSRNEPRERKEQLSKAPHTH
jgi:hypothetical protein